jgi:small basic protein
VGILLGALVRHDLLPPEWLNYVAVGVLAGLDTICGGIRSSLEQKFHMDIFVSGFLSNIVIAFFLAWLGDRIGVNLFLVCALIFGSRIFTNLSLIRRFVLTKWQDARLKKQQTLQAQQTQQAPASQAQ